LHVAIAVIERRGRVLISQRRRGSHLAGYWEFPGGKRELRESAPACLRRELREELGIAARPGKRLMLIRFRYPSHAVWLYAFRCTILSGTPTPLGCTRIRWVSLKQLGRLKLPPANRPLVEFLLRQERCVARERVL